MPQIFPTGFRKSFDVNFALLLNNLLQKNGELFLISWNCRATSEENIEKLTETRNYGLSNGIHS